MLPCCRQGQQSGACGVRKLCWCLDLQVLCAGDEGQGWQRRFCKAMCQGVNVAARVIFGKGTLLSVLPGEPGLVLEAAIASFLPCSCLFAGPQLWEAQCLQPCQSPALPCICFPHTAPALCSGPPSRAFCQEPLVPGSISSSSICSLDNVLWAWQCHAESP